MTFQLFDFITGYAAMKDLTEATESSCSRIIRPGLFEPVNHLVIDEFIAWGVVPGGESLRLQSLVLASGQQCVFERDRQKNEKTHSWFQMTVVRPNTSLAIARVRASLSVRN